MYFQNNIYKVEKSLEEEWGGTEFYYSLYRKSNDGYSDGILILKTYAIEEFLEKFLISVKNKIESNTVLFSTSFLKHKNKIVSILGTQAKFT